MNYHDFLQRIEAIQALLGGIDIPADARHVGVAYRIHALLADMKDECHSCMTCMHADVNAESPVAAEE